MKIQKMKRIRRTKAQLVSVVVVVAMVTFATFATTTSSGTGTAHEGSKGSAGSLLLLVDANGAESGGLELEQVPVAPGEDATDVLRDRTDVVAVSSGDVVYRAAATPSNDTYRSQQWALNRLAAEDARALATGAGVTVAVIDSGVDATHPDLAPGILLQGADFMVSSDGSGGNGWTDTFGHGTHVSGLMAATVDNSVGTAGLAPAITILPIRAMDDAGQVSDARLAAALLWAIQHDVDVINLSLGAPEYSSVVAAAVQAAQDQGIVVIAAAGNLFQSGNPTFYPAAFPGVVGVGATTVTDARAGFSETGTFVDVAAPGADVLSTCAGSLAVSLGGSYGGRYCRLNGTSMATAYTSALAAMIRQRYPSLTVTEIAARIATTAQDLGPVGTDTQFGAGIIQPTVALSFPPDTAPPVISGVGAAVSATGAVVSWTTDESSSSLVSYGPTATLGSTATTAGNTTAHSVTITGLTCATTYHYQVSSTDPANNTATSPAGTATLTTSACAGPGAPFSDDFNATTLDPRWTYVNPAGDVTLSFTGTGARFDIPVGPHDLWIDNQNAPRLLQPVANTDFEIEAKFDTTPAATIQLEGIHVEAAPGTFARFTTYHYKGVTYLDSQTMTNNVPTSRAKITLPAGTALWIRVTRTGNTWTARYSRTGTTWTTYATYNYAMTVTKLGPYAGTSNGGTGPYPTFTSTIDYFHNTASPGG